MQAAIKDLQAASGAELQDEGVELAKLFLDQGEGGTEALGESLHTAWAEPGALTISA